MKRIYTLGSRSSFHRQEPEPSRDTSDPLPHFHARVRADPDRFATAAPDRRDGLGDVKIVRIYLDVEIPLSAIRLRGMDSALLALYCRTNVYANAPQIWRVLVNRLRQKVAEEDRK